MTEPVRALERFSFLFANDGGYIRIPIWGHIPLTRGARRVIEHRHFVRLSGIRQLGFVHHVFPGASHTRFEHSVGAYHLSVLMLQRLVLNPVNWRDSDECRISPQDARVFLAAALLHDIGHYPFAHLVDRLTVAGKNVFETHEDRARDCIAGDRSEGSLYAILRDEWGIGDPERVADVISSPSDAGLPGRMLSGILDPDKLDYLMRDGWACGVPYGNVDADRLIESLVLDVDGPSSRLGITEKGVAPLESLVFAKYMMFRHIYWHHAVRIAAAMFVRFAQDAIEADAASPADFYELSDDALVERLASSSGVPSVELVRDLKARTLYKRGITLYAESGRGGEEFSISGDALDRVRDLYWKPEVRREKERAICRLVSAAEGIALDGYEILLDIPRVTTVFDVEDFESLRVLVKSQTGGPDEFVPFGKCGFSQLTADFAQEFERYARRVQVICRPDLREAVIRHRAEIKAVVTNGAGPAH